MSKTLHVRTNDMVQVIAGEYKGVRGRILEANPQDDRVVVEGVNEAWKHIQPSRENPRGGRVEMEAPIHVSNVMLLCQNRDCEKHDDPVRPSYEFDADGNKQRVCSKCGHPIVPEE